MADLRETDRQIRALFAGIPYDKRGTAYELLREAVKKRETISTALDVTATKTAVRKSLRDSGNNFAREIDNESWPDVSATPSETRRNRGRFIGLAGSVSNRELIEIYEKIPDYMFES